MPNRGHNIAIVIALAWAAGCAEPPQEAPAPVVEPRTEAPPEAEPDRSAEIQARNREILDRLEREQLARENEPAVKPEAPPPPETQTDRSPSGMEEMKARAAALEPQVATIGRMAERVDDNYRRYLDACYEKYTTATASPYTAELYYEPYQPVTISNETTPYCRKLWSDIERDADAVELGMQSLSTEARRQGVLPGHLRELARKYNLDREGWRF